MGERVRVAALPLRHTVHTLRERARASLCAGVHTLRTPRARESTHSASAREGGEWERGESGREGEGGSEGEWERGRGGEEGERERGREEEEGQTVSPTLELTRSCST
eukprot:628805-Rhodomonas_salina.1